MRQGLCSKTGDVALVFCEVQTALDIFSACPKGVRASRLRKGVCSKARDGAIVFKAVPETLGRPKYDTWANRP